MDMHRLGHPSYANLDMEVVRRRAAALPEEGIPPEVLKVITDVDADHDKLQPQKAATPCDGMTTPEKAGQTFAAQRARAIVADGQSNQEANQLELAALEETRQALMTEPEKKAEAAAAQHIEVRTGNQFLDQFQPYYFAIAFPFCFKHSTACPDVVDTTKHRIQQLDPLPRRQAGNRNAPHVDIQDWAAGMARRVETQFRRDWTFGFTVWNFLFRTMVNLQKNTYMYAVPDTKAKGGRRMLTGQEIADGVREIYGKLRNGTYVDISGERKPINGDATKLRHGAGLSEAAQKVMSNVEARARNIPGTHEVRRTMRHQTHANRVCYGTAIFITFSPSERDTTLMLRLARARQADPAVQQDGSAMFQRRNKPALDIDYEYIRLSPEALAEDLGVPLHAI